LREKNAAMAMHMETSQAAPQMQKISQRSLTQAAL